MAIAAGGGHRVHAQIHCELREQKKGRQQRGPEQVFPPREGDGESAASAKVCALAVTEAIIDEIEALAPGSYREDTAQRITSFR